MDRLRNFFLGIFCESRENPREAMTCINPPGRGVSKACKILTKAFDSKPFARHVSFVNSLPACFQFRAALRTWKWFAGCEVCEFIERGIFSIQSFTLVYKRGCSASSVSHFTTDYSPALPLRWWARGVLGSVDTISGRALIAPRVLLEDLGPMITIPSHLIQPFTHKASLII